LGRGLEALLGRTFASEESSYANPVQEPAAPAPYGVASEGGYSSDLPQALMTGVVDGGADVTRSSDGQQWLPLVAVDRNPYQPRTEFDEADIADLCDSIRTHGFLQPIVVRRAEGRYQLIAGERRLRAAQMAGWERVPVQIRDVTDRQAAELAIVENIQRKDLNPIEKAASFQRYMDEYQCTQEDLAGRVNVDRSTIANLVRLLELPAEVKQMVSHGDITAGHARALLPLGDEQEQMEFAKRIQKDSLSVRATEQAVTERIRRSGSAAVDCRRGRQQPPFADAAGPACARHGGAAAALVGQGRNQAEQPRARADYDPLRQPRRIPSGCEEQLAAAGPPAAGRRWNAGVRVHAVVPARTSRTARPSG
jgi:ParB family chromosome partitioning protein